MKTLLPDRLPPIPGIASSILALRINTEEGERKLFDLVQKDPVILSRIIGLSNSPLFGTNRRIYRLRDAAAVIGIKRIKMISLSSAMMTALSRPLPGKLDVRCLWLHSLSVAMTMDTIGRHMPESMRPPEDAIYLAGLLHDIGFLVLDCAHPDLSDRLQAAMISNPGVPVTEIEAGIGGADHSSLGAELMRRWGLPPPIAEVLEFHHAPPDSRQQSGEPLVTMTGIAERLVPACGITENVPHGIGKEEWEKIGIDPSLEAEITLKVSRHAKDAEALAAS